MEIIFATVYLTGAVVGGFTAWLYERWDNPYYEPSDIVMITILSIFWPVVFPFALTHTLTVGPSPD